MRSIPEFWIVCAGVLLAVAGAPSRDARAQMADAVLAFDAGNQLYRDGQYEQALDAYSQALDLGYTSGALYFNMGNAYFRLDNLGQAIRYYEKSRVLIPDNPELLHSIGIAHARAVDQFSRVPRPIWVTWWRAFVAQTAGRWFLWPGLAMYTLAVWLIARRLLDGSRNPWLRRARAVTLLAAGALLAAAFTASIQAHTRQQAVVVADQAGLLDAPTPNAGVTLTIHEGLVVELLDTSETWVEVRLPNGVTGWVEAGAVADV